MNSSVWPSSLHGHTEEYKNVLLLLLLFQIPVKSLGTRVIIGLIESRPYTSLDLEIVAELEAGLARTQLLNHAAVWL